MEMTNVQKVALAMLAEIHQKLGIDNGVNSELVAKALWGGNEWAISWEHGFLIQGDKTPEHVKHVVDVLDMYAFLEPAYAALDDDGKAIVHAAYPYGAPRFPGFDGNEEGEYYSAARFLIDEMNRFGSYAGRELNSHSATVATSERMLAAFLPIRNSLGSASLNAHQIAEVMASSLRNNARS